MVVIGRIIVAAANIRPWGIKGNADIGSADGNAAADRQRAAVSVVAAYRFRDHAVSVAYCGLTIVIAAVVASAEAQ